MPTLTDQTVHNALAGLITFLVVTYALALLVRSLQRSRPELSIGPQVVAALVVRILAAAAVSLTALAGTLRGGDEVGFLNQAHEISATPFGSGEWLDALTGALYKAIFAVQINLLDSPETVLRITQGAIAVAGVAFLAATVYELAGPRAAGLTAWILALEPTSVFFSTLLHKEANMLLAGGLVVYGGTLMWKRGELRALVPMVVGCLIAVATRPYAGWFLIAAAAAITLHAGLRSTHRGSARSLSLVAIVVLFAALSAPTVLEATSEESLEQLQSSQEANVSDESNLKLERVDFSTRTAIITNLPQRVSDLVFRPYPWQLDNVSQQVGLFGTLVAYTTLFLLVGALWSARGAIFARAAPLVYLTSGLLIAYALSAGNAGTGFRYRMHILAAALCLLIVLRLAHAARPVPAAERPAPPRTQPRPIAAGGE